MKICVPIILLLGIFGNLINVYVLTRNGLKQLAIFRMLTYLSGIDFLYISIGLPHIIGIVYFDYNLRISGKKNNSLMLYR